MKTSLALLAALVGCGASIDALTPDDDTEVAVDDHEPQMPLAPRGLLVRAVGGDGVVFPDAAILDGKDSVYFRIFGHGGGHVDTAYRFRVVDLAGALLSSDSEACRRVHVDQ